MLDMNKENLEEQVKKTKKSTKVKKDDKKVVAKKAKKAKKVEDTSIDTSKVEKSTKKVKKSSEEPVKVVKEKKEATAKKKATKKTTKKAVDKKEKDEVVKAPVKKKKTTAVKKIKEEPVEELVKEEATSDTDEVVKEIETKVAEEAEKDDEKTSIPMLEYDTMELESLVEELQKLIKEHPVQQLKSNIDAIKNVFNAKFGALLAEKKTAFLEEGGNSIDFQYSSPVKASYNSLLSDYKTKRDAYYAALDQQLKGNLEKRFSVINELKELIDDADTKTMYKIFKGLQTRWREIGPVPRNKYNDTWRNYHHHVERFYDLLHLSNDFRDLDFKHNLEEKIKLIERVEALVEKEDVNEAFKELQDLHKAWKEDIGPVSKEYREDIWQKFSTASKKIHDKRHEYYRGLRSQYQSIIDAKNAISEKIEAYDISKNTKHSDWRKSIRDIDALRQQYFDAGKLPYAKSEEVWQKFKEATKKFNHAKNLFYKNEKKAQQKNLDEKNKLIALAESLKDSEDWETTTNTFKKIQADWKKIGHVPRKFSDDIWKKFKNACNHYFDRLHAKKGSIDKEQQVVVDAKKSYLEEVKLLKNVSIEEINEVIVKWKDLGALPRNVKHLEIKFNKAVDALLSGLSLSKDEITMLKFKNMINSYVDQKDVYKLNSELTFIRKKVDEANREIQQLENNLSFFSNATADNPLVKNVHANIKKYKDGLGIWVQKLAYIKKQDY